MREREIEREKSGVLCTLCRAGYELWFYGLGRTRSWWERMGLHSASLPGRGGWAYLCCEVRSGKTLNYSQT